MKADSSFEQQFPLRAPPAYTKFVVIGFIVIFAFYTIAPAWAQSSLEGRITQTIDGLVRIVNVLIAGFIVWSGFLIAKGEHNGFHRLIYGVVGLVVANASYLIINYFSWY